MPARTTAAVALAATALTPGVARAAREADDPPSPLRTALRADVAGHLTVAEQMRAARAARERRRLSSRASGLARRLAHARGDAFAARRYATRVRGEDPDALRDRLRRLRRELRDARTPDSNPAPAAPAAPAAPPALAAIAACESGGDPTAVSASGTYRGKYQFDAGTWASVGGSGDPAAAPEAEQDRRAAMLYARAGSTPWPVCGG